MMCPNPDSSRSLCVMASEHYHTLATGPKGLVCGGRSKIWRRLRR